MKGTRIEIRLQATTIEEQPMILDITGRITHVQNATVAQVAKALYDLETTINSETGMRLHISMPGGTDAEKG